MYSATLLAQPAATRGLSSSVRLSCLACFGEVDGRSDTGLYCATCACRRCGEDATASAAEAGYCEACSTTLAAEGFFG